MSSGPLPSKMTYSEVLLLPENDPRIELYDGEVWVMPSNTFVHQDVCLNTLVVIHEYERRVGGHVAIAPLDVIFSEYDVVQPDVLYFVPERVHLLDMNDRPRHRPDIVVEILAPGTESNDRGRKLRMYEHYEVPEYWMLDTDARTLDIRSLRGAFYEVTVTASGDDVVTSPLLPDLSFAVSRLFEDSLA